MAEEKEGRLEDEEDKGVKIEIHGEDDPADEKKPETEASESADSGKTEEEKPEGAGAEEDLKEKAEEKTGKDGEDKAPSEKEEEKADSDQQDDKADDKPGKGFFGSRDKKEKKDKKDEKIAELTDRVQRQMAEFDNFRKRTEREKAAMFDMGKKDAIEKILPIVDSFERGLGDVKEESDDPFRTGMQKVYKQLMTALDSMGVKPIEAEGKPFDPSFHNAVMHCEDDSVGENIVVQELQKGYMMNDTVIRHSMVKVAN